MVSISVCRVIRSAARTVNIQKPVNLLQNLSLKLSLPDWIIPLRSSHTVQIIGVLIQLWPTGEEGMGGAL